jgi:hypothetical protein
MTNKERDQAALICAASASTNIGQDEACSALGISVAGPSAVTARAAYYAAEVLWNRQGHLYSLSWVEQMAEAEALLRCGWSP